MTDLAHALLAKEGCIITQKTWISVTSEGRSSPHLSKALRHRSSNPGEGTPSISGARAIVFPDGGGPLTASGPCSVALPASRGGKEAQSSLG